MAQKILNVIVERHDDFWRVWADPVYVQGIADIEGVTGLNYNQTMKHFTLVPDPRYDKDSLEHEIVELCGQETATDDRPTGAV